MASNSFQLDIVILRKERLQTCFLRTFFIFFRVVIVAISFAASSALLLVSAAINIGNDKGVLSVPIEVIEGIYVLVP